MVVLNIRNNRRGPLVIFVQCYAPDSILPRILLIYTDLLLSYRYGLEKCLFRPNFLGTPTISALQAIVLFIYAAQHAPLSAPLDALLALAVQAARKLKIHEENTYNVREPGRLVTIAQKTEGELQRRLWWHILALDVQLAERSGSDPTIWEGMWSCRMPGNLDDVELDLFSERPLPPRDGEVFDPENQYMHDQSQIEGFLAS